MALNFPKNRKEITNRIQSDVQSQLPTTNPSLRNSFLRAMTVAFGGRVYEVYLKLKQVMLALFPQTAIDEWLYAWGSYVGLNENAAKQAAGYITISGTADTIVPQGTLFTTASGGQYTTKTPVSIDDHTLTIVSLTFNAGTAVARTATEHLLASNIQVTITGASQTEYNGTFKIFVTADDEFTYTIVGSPVSPATGAPQVTSTTASVAVESTDYGISQNLDQGAMLTISTPISGVNPAAYVQFDTVSGGADQETQAQYQKRVMYRYQNPLTPFNEADIVNLSKTLTGITRVFVETPDTQSGHYDVVSIVRVDDIATVTTADPHGLISGQTVSISGADQPSYNASDAVVLVVDDTTFVYIVKNDPTTPATGTIEAAFAAVQPGQVKVFFTRDEDPSIIPTGAEVDQLKALLLTIKPAHMAERDLMVAAPTPVSVDFTFTSLEPDSGTMRQAVNDVLVAFFRESNNVGQDLLKLSYETAIYSTVDTVTGTQIRNFTLSAPSGNVIIQSGEIPVLGEVLFP